jgi:hypothetical protein
MGRIAEKMGWRAYHEGTKVTKVTKESQGHLLWSYQQEYLFNCTPVELLVVVLGREWCAVD